MFKLKHTILRLRSLSNHLDQTSSVNKGFIMHWLYNLYKFARNSVLLNKIFPVENLLLSEIVTEMLLLLGGKSYYLVSWIKTWLVRCKSYRPGVWWSIRHESDNDLICNSLLLIFRLGWHDLGSTLKRGNDLDTICSSIKRRWNWPLDCHLGQSEKEHKQQYVVKKYFS